MIKNFNISQKLITSFILIGLVPLSIIGTLSFFEFKATVNGLVQNQLISLREAKKNQIEHYFVMLKDQAIEHSNEGSIINAVKDFTAAFWKIEGELSAEYELNRMENEGNLKERYKYQEEKTCNPPSDAMGQWWPSEKVSRILQHHYISSNPKPVGQKHKLDYALDGSTYSEAHKKYHSWMRNIFEITAGYYDIFLIEPETGYIVYSVFKELDFATSLLTGPYKNSNLGKVFKAAVSSDDKDSVFLVDFGFYGPSYNQPAAFIASPIYEGEKKLGVLAFQISIDNINEIMTSHKKWKDVGLGSTAETYLVGDDFTMRNDSRFLIETPEKYFKQIEQLAYPEETINRIKSLNTTILLQKVITPGTEDALKGNSEFDIFPDYRNVPVLSAYTPVNIEGLNWVLMSEIDKDEAFKSIYKLRNRILAGILLITVVIVIIGIVAARAISSPIKILSNAALEIGKGNLAKRIDIKSNDEIGELAISFNKMTEELKGRIKIEKDLAAVAAKEEAKKEVIEKNMIMLEEKTKKLSDSRTASIHMLKSLDKTGKELASARDYVENIMRSITESIIVVSPDGTIETVNNAACSLLGYTEEELVNKHIRTLFEEEDFKKSGFEDLVKKGFIRNIEKTFISKDGKKIPVLFSGSVMRAPSDSGPRKTSGLSRSEHIAGQDEEGKIQGIVCVAADITKLKQTEDQIRMLSRAVEQSPSTVVITDANGNIEYVNPKFTQLTGYSFEEVVGKNPRILKSGKQSVEVYKQLWDTITSGREWHGELHNKKKNGQLCWESALIFPIKNQEGTITHFIALKEDITASKRLEDEKQDMEMKMLASSKLATLGEMATGVAHEINQPLTYISGAIQGLREDFEMDDVDKENAIKTLGKSRRQVERITQIIQHLRTFGRAGDVEMRNVVIKKVLDNTLLLLGEKMQLSNIDFTCKEDDDVPLIKGNENQLEQVFINLLQNSIYAVKKKEYNGARITVAIRKMKEKNRIQIDFSDNGNGITPEHLENIFDPFFTTKPVGEGTGLGLSIIHSIIQSHGGEITCESEVGKGTTFVITLPA